MQSQVFFYLTDVISYFFFPHFFFFLEGFLKLNLTTTLYGLDGMRALFTFEGISYTMLLTICSATYVRILRPGFFRRDDDKTYRRFLYKCSVIGDRLSPWVSLGCLTMAFRILFSP